MLRQMRCTKGQIIVKQGTPAFEAYYIEEGAVEVKYQDGDHVISLGQLGPGELFGEMGVIEQEPREASVEALADTSLLVIPKEEVLRRIKDTDEKIVRSVIETLIKRLRESNKGQLRYYKNMTNFQDRLIKINDKAGKGIDVEKRKKFQEEVMPLLDQLEKVLDKYKY